MNPETRVHGEQVTVTTCPRCRALLPDSAISESVGAARCPACRALVDLNSSRAVQLPLTAPDKWKVEAAPGSLQVRWPWFSLVVFILVPFTLFWNGILSVAAFNVTDGLQHPERLLVGLALPHAWVGVGLAYYCLTLFFNSTTVQVSEGTLRVRHGPLFWPGNRTVPLLEVEQLFVVARRAGRAGIKYDLCMLLRGGMRQSLLTNLPGEAAARFLERRLEQSMNIVDQTISGELRGGSIQA